ncbi:PAS domain S-box protein [Noviherbaspirillum sp.]|jgi:PAS domain S-box-containing protein|uniref:PAS domain-containing protein n=1 Tax=Noviherbaspirillum sp. TaxID=1926288 RepID=UPI0025D1BE10|nr:PAS domain S-box protein [Noviherbaspirillum sp.]
MGSIAAPSGQAEAQEIQKRFRLAFERAPIGMLVRGADARALQANKALQDMLGYSVDELTQMDIDTLIHEDDRSLGTALNRELFSGRRDSYQIEKRFRHKDGHELWCKVDASLVRDSLGHPYFSVNMVEDITDRKHFDEAIKRSVSRYELILNAARWGVVGIEASRTIAFANPSANGMLGWVDDALIGEPVGAILHEHGGGRLLNEVRSAICGAISDGLIRHAENGVLLRHSGALLFVEYTVAPIVEEGRVSGVALIFMDLAGRADTSDVRDDRGRPDNTAGKDE